MNQTQKEGGGRPQRGFGGKHRDGGRAHQKVTDGDRWVPITKLGRLVATKRVTSIEEIFQSAIPVKETEIIVKLLPNLSEEVMKVSPVQKQTCAGQRTRYKVCVIVGDYNGHVGLGMKCAKEVPAAIAGAISAAKLSIIPVRRGFWGTEIGKPHTIPMKVSGKCGSVKVRLVPAPKGTGIVAAGATKKLLQFAGVEDCYTSSRGSTCTTVNLLGATYKALAKTYEYIIPSMWKIVTVLPHPLEKNAEYLYHYDKNSTQSLKDPKNNGDLKKNDHGRSSGGGGRFASRA